ncbi:hypothetical protein BC940DRAFT_290267 [Gongronella butleri]|nr:hypothetical protein BC940DRAFT_290267 [Gongronella butleri]
MQPSDFARLACWRAGVAIPPLFFPLSNTHFLPTLVVYQVSHCIFFFSFWLAHHGLIPLLLFCFSFDMRSTRVWRPLAPLFLCISMLDLPLFPTFLFISHFAWPASHHPPLSIALISSYFFHCLQRKKKTRYFAHFPHTHTHHLSILFFMMSIKKKQVNLHFTPRHVTMVNSWFDGPQ